MRSHFLSGAVAALVLLQARLGRRDSRRPHPCHRHAWCCQSGQRLGILRVAPFPALLQDIFEVRGFEKGPAQPTGPPANDELRSHFQFFWCQVTWEVGSAGRSDATPSGCKASA